MLHGSQLRRAQAHAAIRSFLLQSYPAKELVIVNSAIAPDLPSFRPLLDNRYGVATSLMREIFVPRYSAPRVDTPVEDNTITLGDLRNIALGASTGQWFISWDDDDWSHPDRLTHMMDQAQPGCAVMPKYHLRYHQKTNTAYMWGPDDGKWFRGNIALYPRIRENLFPRQELGEDTAFLEKLFVDRMIHWDNRSMGHEFIYFCHGTCHTENIQEKFLGKYNDPAWHGCWVRKPDEPGYLKEYQTEYLKTVLRDQYARKIDGRPWPS